MPGAGLRVFTVGREGDDLRIIKSEIDGYAQSVTLQFEGKRHALHLPLVGEFQIEDRSSSGNQWRSLVQALIPLPNGHAVDGNAATDTKLQTIVMEFEAPDDHVEVCAGQRTD